MRRYYQIASVSFLALGIFIVFEGHRLKYYTDIGPGPGFYPVWVGGLIALLSVIWLGEVSFRPVEPMPDDFIPRRDRALHVLATLAALVLYTAGMTLFGFRLTTLAFLVFLLRGLGRVSIAWTAIIALAGSWGVYYAFKQLEVFLPVASIDLLGNLGL
jgi:putative tricarboxylic transport membrane protein